MLCRVVLLCALFCSMSTLHGAIIPLDIDNSQFQGAERRIFPQIANAATLFPIDGTGFDHTFKFSEMEYLHANQDFGFQLVIFLDTTAALNPPTTFDATWQFLDANMDPIATFANMEVDYRDPGVPRLELNNQSNSSVLFGSMGWDIYGIRVAATLPDLESLASPASINVLSPNPGVQEAAEFALFGTAAKAWEIRAVPEPSPFLLLSFLAVAIGIRNRLRVLHDAE